MRNRTSDLRIPRSHPLLLSDSESTVSEVHNARISDVDSVMLGTVSNTRDKTKNSFLYFFSELKTCHHS